MSIWEAIVLGIVQGLTEFLPVSSSGHLVFLHNVFGMAEPQLFFDTMLHLGTLFAVVIVMWKTIVDIFKNFFSKTTLCLVVATVPAVVVALLFSDFVESTFTGAYLGYGFLLTACILALSELAARRVRTKRPAGYGSATTMGLMQALAIFPGVSRSGSTIAGGLVFGLERRQAANFSFLMSVPIILGSVLKQGYDVVSETGLGSVAWVPTIIGTVCAAVSGYFAVRFMLALIKKKRLYGFAVYVAVLGAFVLLDQYLLKMINWA